MSLVVVSAVATGRSEEPREQRWRLQAGWVHQWGQSMEVRGPAPSLYNSLIPRGGSKWFGQLPPGAMTGPEDGLPVVWNFDDGYVFPDEESGVRPGGDPGAPLSTHYWHYQNAGQYDSVADTLTFHRDLGLRSSGSPGVRGDNDDTFQSDGVEIKASRWLHTWEEWDVDLDLVVGVAFFPDTQTMRNERMTEQNMVRETETYTYSDYFGSPAGGNWQPGLDHWYPYYGRFRTNDDPPGDNPIIPLDYEVSSERTPGVIRDTAQIEGRLWRLRGEVGPTFTKPLTRRVSVYVAPQLALEFVDACVHRSETVTFTENGQTSRLGSRSDHNDKTTVVPGFLLTAGTDCLVSENWYVGGSLGWEWLSRDVTVSVGPDRVRFDLDGYELNLYLGRKF